MPELSTSAPASSEASPLLPTTLVPPSSPHPRVSLRPLRSSPRSYLFLLLPLLVAIPSLAYFLFEPRISLLPHPGISASGPIHLAVPHVPLSFVALGDWGRKGKHGQRHVAKAMSDTVQTTLIEKGYNPHFLISTGDNFYSSGVSSVDDDHFDQSYRNVYNHVPLSSIPWYSVLGNHDHIGNIAAQVQFTTRDPRWNMPATYFAQRFADNLVAIFLDTTPFVAGEDGENARQKNGQNQHAQLRWLKRQLADSPPSAYFLIIGHHNLYTMSTAGHLGSNELRDMLEPVLMPYKDRTLAYISGHEHSLMHMQPYPRADRDDAQAPYTAVVDHFISGAGSKIDDIVTPPMDEIEKWKTCCGVLPKTEDATAPRTVWGDDVHGFFVFRFDGRTFTARAINSDGKVVYKYEKTVA